MTDTPPVHTPLEPDQEQILQKVLHLRHELCVLRQDKSTYVKSHDVFDLYDQVIAQVHLLNILREERGVPQKQNRLDSVLDDCFQLISLFFLTIGRNNEAPAALVLPYERSFRINMTDSVCFHSYALTSTIRRLLDHLQEVTLYSAKDLESAVHTLNKTQESLTRGKEGHSPHLLKLLEYRLATCRRILAELQDALAGMSPELVPIHEQLISILRSISAANTRQKFPTTEVQGFQKQLQEIQSQLPGIEQNTNEKSSLVGLDTVTELLSRCLEWAEMVLLKQGKIDERFRPTYDQLFEIRNALEKLSLTQTWSLRETDLYEFQRRLDRFDESRIEGNFEDEQGNKADLHTQRTLLYLLRRSYAYIYVLLISSEPVSEALLPVFNQLQTLRRCFIEVKRSGGVSSLRELHPYSMKLSSIANMRTDGKFLIGSEAPEGQHAVNSLLAECSELLETLGAEAQRPIQEST